MKTSTILTLSIVLAVLLTGCRASDGTGNDSAPMGGPAAGALPELSQIVIGTLKLDATEQAVDAEQAAELLPLWQTYQSLSTSDAAAKDEMDALADQIRETMTSEQMQAITDMQLTRDDMFAVMQELGIEMGAGPRTGGTTTDRTEFRPPDGGAGFPGGGGGFQGGPDGGQGLSPDQIATAQAARASGGGLPFDRIPSPLLEALIQSLQEKAGE